MGGSFTSDPSKYLSSDKIAVKGNDGYAFTVIAKSETAAEVVPSVPSVTEPTLPEDATEAEQELADSVVGALKGDNAPAISSDAVSSAANMVANENQMTSESQEVIDALADAGVDTEGETVTIVVQPYIDVKVESVSISEDGEKSITLEITPMYRTVAIIADVAGSDEIVLNGENVNAAQIGEAQELEIDSTVTVKVPLPEDFIAG